MLIWNHLYCASANCTAITGIKITLTYDASGPNETLAQVLASPITELKE